MRIQNKNLANTVLRGVRGDAEGVFDLPDALGAVLVKTPGWTAVKVPRSLSEARPAPEPVPDAPKAPEPPQEPEPDAVLESATATVEEEGPDLEIMTKKQLLAAAVEYGVEVDQGLTKTELYKTLKAAIYGVID